MNNAVCLSVSGLFLSIDFSQGSPMVCHVTGFPYFPKMNHSIVDISHFLCSSINGNLLYFHLVMVDSFPTHFIGSVASSENPDNTHLLLNL